MSITVIVARKHEKAEQADAVEVVLGGGALTAANAKIARELAFGDLPAVVVAHGWGEAFYVPGIPNRQKRRGAGGVYRMWSAERTRRLFGNAKEET